VSNIISKHQIPILDSDLIARKVVEPGAAAYQKIVKNFGTDIVLTDGSLRIDRAKLGQIVFNNPKERAKLNRIVHPAVQWEIIKSLVKCWMRGEKICVVDMPLLIETGSWRWVGFIVVVYT